MLGGYLSSTGAELLHEYDIFSPDDEWDLDNSFWLIRSRTLFVLLGIQSILNRW